MRESTEWRQGHLLGCEVWCGEAGKVLVWILGGFMWISGGFPWISVDLFLFLFFFAGIHLILLNFFVDFLCILLGLTRFLLDISGYFVFLVDSSIFRIF